MPLPRVLRQEFATLEKSFLSFMGFFGGQGFVLSNPDRTLQAKGGGRGLELYDRVLEDCHAHAVFQQRKLELISREWRVEAASEDAADVAAAELADAQLEALGMRDFPDAQQYGGQGFDGVALSLLDATAKGYSVGEIMWAMDGREIYPAEVRPKDPRRFGWVMGDNGWELRLITDAAGTQGEPLPDRKFIYHSPTATDSNPYGLGLCSKVFWPVFFKRQNIQFWLIFADKFGSPTPIGKYPVGTSEGDKETLLEALSNLTQGMATTVPEGMLIELLEATRSGSVDTYERLAKYCDQQISEAVLGQTGTMNQSDSGGSRARDEVAREGMISVISADADLLSRTLDRTLLRWITELNRPILGERAQPPHFKWIFDEEEDVNLVAARDKVLFDMGWARSEESIAEVYGEGFERKATPAPVDLSDRLPDPAPEVDEDEVELAEGDPVLPATELPRRWTARLAEDLGPISDRWIEQISALLEVSGSFEEFSAALGQLYPELNKDGFANTLRDAVLATMLGGAAEVEVRG
jgi:phage gp29-like protein